MDLVKSEILSPALFTLKARLANPLDAAFDGDNDVSFSNNGGVLVPDKPIDNYAWIELEVRPISSAIDVVTINARNNTDQSSVGCRVDTTQAGQNAKSFVIIPNIGPIDEIEFYSNAANLHVIKSIRVVLFDSRLTKLDPIANGRATLTASIPGPNSFVYNPTYQAFIGTINPGAVDTATLLFTGLADGYEWGVVRVESRVTSTGTQGALQITFTSNGIAYSITATYIEFWLNGDATLNIYPKALTLFNPPNGFVTNYRVSVEMQSWNQASPTVWGASATQVLTSKPQFQPNTSFLSGLTGYLKATGGVASAVLTIPFSDITPGSFAGQSIIGLQEVTATLIRQIGSAPYKAIVADLTGYYSSAASISYNPTSKAVGVGANTGFPNYALTADTVQLTASFGIGGAFQAFDFIDTDYSSYYAAYSTMLAPTNAVTTATIEHYRAEMMSRALNYPTATINNIYGFRATPTLSAAVSGSTYLVAFASEINGLNGNTRAFLANSNAQSNFFGPIGLGIGDVSANADMLGIQIGNSSALGAYNTGARVYNSVPASSGTYAGFSSDYQTPNSAVTYANIIGFHARSFTKGAASTVNAATAFYAATACQVSPTNNYGFYCDFSFTLNDWTFYGPTGKAGFGYLGVGTNPGWSGGGSRFINTVGTLVAASSFANLQSITFDVTVVTAGHGFWGALGTAAGAQTLAISNFYRADSFTKGAGSTVTNIMGFAASNGIAQGTNNYGFWCDIASATNNFQLFMSGTAKNQLKGGVILDTTAAPTVAANQVGLGATTATTVGAAGAAAALPATPTGYLIINVAGSAQKIPYYN